MLRSLHRFCRAALIASLAALFLLLEGGVVSVARAETAQGSANANRIIVPLMDAQRGRQLFVNKGCVVCHQVNGVGGKAAPALDADPAATDIDLADFIARMWRGAPTMIVLQEMELGYQIELTGQELADLAAFSADAQAQAGFSEADIPEVVRGWMVDQVYDELDLDNMAQ